MIKPFGEIVLNDVKGQLEIYIENEKEGWIPFLSIFYGTTRDKAAAVVQCAEELVQISNQEILNTDHFRKVFY
ncbi:TPA: hypothetical protein QCN93_004766 [Bacillus pacificus]|nr:hypothetical protein [Bacillus pacificus]